MTLSKLFHKPLAIITKAVLHTYRPFVIGITGSVGKTSTKDAVSLVLAGTARLRATKKNYNNELGVPFTVLAVDAPGRSIFGWIGVFLKGWKLLMQHDSQYPEILVLELGADHKGDIKMLSRLTQPSIGVITGISHAHTEFLGSIDEVAKEKSVLIKTLPKDGYAILNADDDRVLALRSSTHARVLTYGQSDEADVRILNVHQQIGMTPEENILTATIQYNNENVPLSIPGLLGEHQLNAPLAALTVGVARNIPLSRSVPALANYKAPNGRMRPISGIKHSLIIDDTYNASPAASTAALQTLQLFQTAGNTTYAVLGDMAELGAYSDDDHAEIGKTVASFHIDYLVTVGPQGKKIARAAEEAGMSHDKIFSFDFSRDAAEFLKNRIEEGNVVLCKGSQVMRMERIVKELMAEPERAGELLVRQDASWLQKP